MWVLYNGIQDLNILMGVMEKVKCPTDMNGLQISCIPATEDAIIRELGFKQEYEILRTSMFFTGMVRWKTAF